jgi:hypothetical protein
MEKIKDFKGMEDKRTFCDFAKINVNNFRREVAGYICWDFIEEKRSMMYFAVDMEGKVLTPFVNTREQAMMDCARYLEQILNKSSQQRQ